MFSEASSLEPITGPDALFDLDAFLQTFSHVDVGAENKLSPDKGKEKEDIDYRVYFRRPSIDPPFTAESSTAQEALEESNTSIDTDNTVSNFDANQNIVTEENMDTEILS
ncbi:hypothetical protein L1987_19095 [Smallanthus sonchifolius]|uniref:Uncharacterized protein n=1 Tax=Smallanthus sonchifolius TaxID=185202 RepID=A0ACB9J1I7_9ASTR|nr:hypothetical protein L1987_19095 [Smallanthus sonchifolius]